MAKLEGKIRELEAELANTQARTGESAKAHQRVERQVKELGFSARKDKENRDRTTDLAAKLQAKIKVYKRQIEKCEKATGTTQKTKISLNTHLDDTKTLGDGESKDRAPLLTKFKALSAEAKDLNIKIDKESEQKTDVKALSKAQSEDEKKSDAQTERYSKKVVARACNGQKKENVLESFTIRIMALSQELCTSELCVRVLQVYIRLVSSHQPKTGRGVVRHLLPVYYQTDQAHWDDPGAVRLLETLVEVGLIHSKLGNRILEDVLGGRMAELNTHSHATFVVQRVLERLEDKERLQTILGELATPGMLEQVLSAGTTGVLLGLAKAAVRLETGQATLLASVTQTLQCQEHQDLQNLQEATVLAVPGIHDDDDDLIWTIIILTYSLNSTTSKPST